MQCCDRDARLFFHYSEFKGDMDTVNIGGMDRNLMVILLLFCQLELIDYWEMKFSKSTNMACM